MEQSLSIPQAQELRIRAETLKHPFIPPVTLNLSNGLSPEEAAVLCVLLNPSLRSVRDRRRIAGAELIKAGILPNPQFAYSSDFPTGGNTSGTVSAFGLGLSWDAAELISRSASIEASSKNKVSVDLDVSWQEWQSAQSAKTAVYDLVSMNGQVDFASSSDQRLANNYETVRQAVQAGLMTELDLSAAETASKTAHSTVLGLKKQAAEQRLKLTRLVGLPPDANIALDPGITLPSNMKVPEYAQLVEDLQEHRLDLVALRIGYESQEETLRAVILRQFPRVNIGLNEARDTSDVVTTGFGLAIDLPIFNRNQGQIEIERATRQKLFDEYTDRVFQARADIGKLLARITLINEEIQTAEQKASSGSRLVQTYRLAVDEGQADVLSYYTAWNDLTQTQVNILQLKQQLADTRIALEIATGLFKLPDVSEAADSGNYEDNGEQQ